MLIHPLRRSRLKVSSRTSLAVLVSVVVLALVSACGSSDSSDERSGDDSAVGQGDPAVVEAAQGRLAPHFDGITGAWVDTPLTSKPEEGKLLYSIRYNIAEAASIDGPFEKATEALGWTVKVLAVDVADPQSQANAMEQAIAAGADFISVSSGSAESIGPGLDAAKEAGIPVFLGAGTTDPGGEKNGIYGNVNAEFLGDGSLRLLDEAIVDSGGKANVLMLSTPDYPIVATAAETAERGFAENCPECSLQSEGVSGQDLASGAGSGIAVAAIRKNPDIKYILTQLSGLAIGLPEALKAAGLDDVKLLITNPDASQVPSLRDGVFLAGAMYPQSALPWAEVDQMARYSLGMDVEQDSHALIPYPVWRSEDVPSDATNYAGAEGFEDGFRELWHVG